MTKDQKSSPKHRHRIFRPVYVLILLIICVSVSIYALRQNNLNMVKLRENVYTADKDDGNVQQALLQLQAYVVDHMNTSLTSSSNAVYPPIQLKYTYQRLQAAASESSSSDSNTQLYTEAEDYCQATVPNGFSGRYRIPCIDNYIEAHKITSPTSIPAGLYEFDFVSPSWSPDLAGWSLVGSVLLVITLAASLAVNYKPRLNKVARRQDQ